ncbi:MAG: HAMP domain-containing sensor histidine kinase [Thermotogota bacterium]|nr:HAMP domain-containing sensor histidine kinase [Thermotogota bacterium]
MSWVNPKTDNTNDYPKTLKRARLLWTFIFSLSIFAIVLFFSVIIIRIQQSTLYSRLDSRLMELTNLSQNALDLFRIQNNEALPGFLFEEGQSIQVYGPADNLRFTIGAKMPDNLKLPEKHIVKLQRERFFQTIKFTDKNGEIKTFRTYSRVITPKLPGVGDLIVRAGIDLEGLIEEKMLFRNRVIMFVLVFPFLSFLMAYILAGIVLQPVKDNYNLLRKFSFDASHELKTPLAVIQMSTGMLLTKKDKLDESTAKKVISIDNASHRMDHLVKQLLHLARAQEYSENADQMGKINVETLIKSIIEEYTPYAQKKGIVLLFSGTTPKKPISDKNILRMIIGNIVENAVKFSPLSQPVEIRLEAVKNMVIVTVKDFGPGIDKSEKEKVFDRFYKVDKSRHDNSGSGMGLSIVKEYSKKTGIKIELESEPGTGTEFFIKIPC